MGSIQPGIRRGAAMRDSSDNQNGFTLAEILVAMVISGIVAALTYGIYISQNRGYLVQEQVVETQQELRLAMRNMVRDVRMAGLADPFNRAPTVGFQDASATRIQFTLDRTGGEADGVDNDGDGVTDEAEESAYADGDTGDANENLTYELVGTNLTRSASGASRTLADNIQNLEFYFLLDGPVPSWTTSPAADRLDDIRSVQVTALARTARADNQYSDTRTYTTPSGTTWGPYNDGLRRRLLSTTVRCRNMGI